MWIKGEYYDALDPVETVARGALDRDAQPCPFDRLDWFRLVAAHAPGPPLIVRARAEGTDAWLFLRQDGAGRLAALATPEAGCFRPIFVGEGDETHRHRLLRAVARRLRRPGLGVSRLALPMLAKADAALIAGAFARAGWTVSARPLPPLWRARTDGMSFEDYLDARPALSADIDQWLVSHPMDFEVSDRITAALWADFEAVAGPASPLVTRWAEAESDARRLRLAVARQSGAAVAAQLWSVERGIATAFILAQPARPRAGEPAEQLTATVLRYLLNVDQVGQVDFGPGGGWLARFTDDSVPRVRLDLFNARRPASWPAAALARASALVRRNPLD